MGLPKPIAICFPHIIPFTWNKKGKKGLLRVRDSNQDKAYENRWYFYEWRQGESTKKKRKVNEDKTSQDDKRARKFPWDDFFLCVCWVKIRILFYNGTIGGEGTSASEHFHIKISACCSIALYDGSMKLLCIFQYCFSNSISSKWEGFLRNGEIFQKGNSWRYFSIHGKFQDGLFISLNFDDVECYAWEFMGKDREIWYLNDWLLRIGRSLLGNLFFCGKRSRKCFSYCWEFFIFRPKNLYFIWWIVVWCWCY